MDRFFSYTLILFLFFSGQTRGLGQEAGNSPLIGKPAPDVVLIKTDGTSGSVVGSRQGKKAVLIFWATWCPHCYEDLGSINEHFAAIEQKGIKLILIDVGETVAGVKNYFNRRQMKLTSFVDEDSFLQGEYSIVGIPTLIFVDEKGIIRNMTHQFPSDYEDYFNVKQ